MSEDFEKYKSLINEFIHEEEETEIVSLSDKICTGCNGCGDCCISAQVKLNAFDIYNMLKHTNQDDLSKKMVFYFGDNSYLPLIILKNDPGNNFCPFIKNINGDFECILGDDKPTCCYNNFLAISFKFDDLSFIPIGDEIKPIDIDKLYENHRVKDSMIIHLKDRNKKKCHAPKEEITVEEFLKVRLDTEKERLLATILPLLLNKYIEVEKFHMMIYLSEHSKVNNKNPFNRIFSGKNNETYDKIMKSMFLELYLFADPESEEDFMTQIKKHIEHLEKSYFLYLRVLYKYLLKVFDPNDYLFNELCKLDDMDMRQERYDSYCEEHVMEISERFIENAGNLIKEIKEVKKE